MAFTTAEENWLKGWRLRFLNKVRPEAGGNGWDAADTLLAHVAAIENEVGSLGARVVAVENKPEPEIPTDVVWPGVLV